MAVAVVVQLEMIDIDHHQRDRLATFAGVLPFALELAVEAAAVGKAGQAVEARQLFEVLIGDAQFLLALGELARHVVERDGKRLELGEPASLRCAHVQFAAAETRRRARQRPDRRTMSCSPPNHATRRTNMPTKPELQVCDAELAIDAALHVTSPRCRRRAEPESRGREHKRRYARRRRSPSAVTVPSSLASMSRTKAWPASCLPIKSD